MGPKGGRAGLQSSKYALPVDEYDAGVSLIEPPPTPHSALFDTSIQLPPEIPPDIIPKGDIEAMDPITVERSFLESLMRQLTLSKKGNTAGKAPPANPTAWVALDDEKLVVAKTEYTTLVGEKAQLEQRVGQLTSENESLKSEIETLREVVGRMTMGKGRGSHGVDSPRQSISGISRADAAQVNPSPTATDFVDKIKATPIGPKPMKSRSPSASGSYVGGSGGDGPSNRNAHKPPPINTGGAGKSGNQNKKRPFGGNKNGNVKKATDQTWADNPATLNNPDGNKWGNPASRQGALQDHERNNPPTEWGNQHSTPTPPADGGWAPTSAHQDSSKWEHSPPAQPRREDGWGHTPPVQTRQNESWGDPPLAQARQNESWGNPPSAQVRQNDTRGNPPSTQVRQNDTRGNPPPTQVRQNDTRGNPPSTQVRQNDTRGYLPSTQVRQNDAWGNPPSTQTRQNDTWGNPPSTQARQNDTRGNPPSTQARQGDDWPQTSANDEVTLSPAQPINWADNVADEASWEQSKPERMSSWDFTPPLEPQNTFSDDLSLSTLAPPANDQWAVQNDPPVDEQTVTSDNANYRTLYISKLPSHTTLSHLVTIIRTNGKPLESISLSKGGRGGPGEEVSAHITFTAPESCSEFYRYLITNTVQEKRGPRNGRDKAQLRLEPGGEKFFVEQVDLGSQGDGGSGGIDVMTEVEKFGARRNLLVKNLPENVAEADLVKLILPKGNYGLDEFGRWKWIERISVEKAEFHGRTITQARINTAGIATAVSAKFRILKEYNPRTNTGSRGSTPGVRIEYATDECEGSLVEIPEWVVGATDGASDMGGGGYHHGSHSHNGGPRRHGRGGGGGGGGGGASRNRGQSSGGWN